MTSSSSCSCKTNQIWTNEWTALAVCLKHIKDASIQHVRPPAALSPAPDPPSQYLSHPDWLHLIWMLGSPSFIPQWPVQVLFIRPQVLLTLGMVDNMEHTHTQTHTHTDENMSVWTCLLLQGLTYLCWLNIRCPPVTVMDRVRSVNTEIKSYFHSIIKSFC